MQKWAKIAFNSNENGAKIAFKCNVNWAKIAFKNNANGAKIAFKSYAKLLLIVCNKCSGNKARRIISNDFSTPVEL